MDFFSSLVSKAFCKRRRSRSSHKYETLVNLPRNHSKSVPSFIPNLTLNKSSVYFANSRTPAGPKYLLQSLCRDSSLDSLYKSIDLLTEAKSQAMQVLNKRHQNLYKIRREKAPVTPSDDSIIEDTRSKFQIFLESHNADNLTEEDILQEWNKVENVPNSLEKPHKDTDLYSQIAEYSLTYKDIKKLQCKKWLNDTIINAYIKLLKPKSNTIILNSYFYQTLEIMANQGWDLPKLKRILRRSGLEKITDIPMIVFPANILQTHWVTICINNTEQVIEYYDSFRSQNLENICLIVEGFLEKMGVIGYDWHEMDTPLQDNTYDCGMFTIKIIQAIADNREFFFSNRDMQYYRRVMLLELKNAQLYVDCRD